MARAAYIILLFLFNCMGNFSIAHTKDSARNSQTELKNVDEFKEFETDSTIAVLPTASSGSLCKAGNKEVPTGFYWTVAILLFTCLAGILVRFKQTRHLRSLFLVASVIVLGFYRGACPCPIQSLQNTAFLFMGQSIKLPSLLYFLGLIPITYLFGRVFCGWICPLGALQEFIFTSSRLKLFQSQRAQKTMRLIRMSVLLLLLAQIIITQTNLYKKIDPFATIYNFYSAYLIGWILVGILLISSLIIYRPFCKTICPIGLLLGWVSKIPGASVLGVKTNCSACSNCNNTCNIRAITHDNKVSILENQECIRCGNCLSGCKKNAMSFFHNGKKHAEKTECKGDTFCYSALNY